jgi:ferredoxin-thioredoxin reductase catalytic subunit
MEQALLDKIENFARKYKLKFGSQKQYILEALLKNKGYCPCRRERSSKTLCPCAYIFEELEKKGRCTCGLFYK